MDDIRISVVLTVAQLNVVLRYLGKGPYDDVATVINAIKTQADAHIAETQRAALQQQIDAEIQCRLSLQQGAASCVS